MDCIDQFVLNIHNQRFYNGTLINPTRFFLLAALLQNNTIKPVNSKREIETIIYRYYADNENIASRHPKMEIRNIKKYGISIIKDELRNALETWLEETPDSILSFNSESITLNVNYETDYSNDVEYLWMIIEELYKKTYGIDFPSILPIEGNDMDLQSFGIGAYRNHLMEEMQYCVCCDEYNINNLYAVHILPDNIASSQVSRESISNGLILCYEHAQEYLHNRFYFSSSGKIVNCSSSIVHKNMRLGQKLLTLERQEYLKIYADHMSSQFNCS